MRYFTTLIKPAGSLCSMSCSYCFYRDLAASHHHKPQIMSFETTYSLIQKVMDDITEETMITFAFQGGEPTLATLDYFINFINIVQKLKKSHHHIQYSIQTNGYTLNESWFNFFKEHHFLVGISLDGMPKIHNQMRKDNNGKNTYETIIKNIRELQKKNIDFNILTVLTNQLSKHPKEIFEFILKNNFKNVQFIPCLPHFNQRKNAYSLQPKEFYHFYDELFSYWHKELKKGNIISIAFFEQFISALAGIRPQGCGTLGSCTNQFVVECDGSIYPCDFYVLDNYRLGNIHNTSIKDAAYSLQAKKFLTEPRNISLLCNSCRYFQLCKGQCKRQSTCFYTDNFCAIQNFLSKHEKELCEIANLIKKR